MSITYKTGTYLADEYLKLKAQQADLASREKAIKEALLRMSDPVVEGRFGRVTITEIEDSMVLSPKLMREHLSPAVQRLCMAPKAGYFRFGVSARVADAKVAA